MSEKTKHESIGELMRGGRAGRSRSTRRTLPARLRRAHHPGAAATVLEISPRTVKRDWTFAQTWLRREMQVNRG